MQEEVRPIRQYRRDVDLCGDLERGEIASRYAYLFGALGADILANIAVRRDLLIQRTAGAFMRRVKDA